jgi:hypothetical protein
MRSRGILPWLHGRPVVVYQPLTYRAEARCQQAACGFSIEMVSHSPRITNPKTRKCPLCRCISLSSNQSEPSPVMNATPPSMTCLLAASRILGSDELSRALSSC